MRTVSSRRWTVIMFVLALVTASCGGTSDVEESDSASVSTSVPSESLYTSDSDVAGTTGTVSSPTAKATPTTITAQTPTSTTIPATTSTTNPATTATTRPVPTTAPAYLGVPYDGPGPIEGDRVAVVGVAFDDSLNVRSGPGVRHGVVTTLPPDAEGIPISEGAMLLPTSLWYGIAVGGGTGWLNSSYIALVGSTDDATALVVDMHGSVPTAESMLELGALVAELFVGGESGTRVEVAKAPTVSDRGEVTYDVIGLADDAVKGYRLHVFGEPQEGLGPFVLDVVERTSLCWRGVTDDGLCI